MARDIQPGDIITVTTKYEIVAIEGDEIIFGTTRGMGVATFDPNSGKYVTRDGGSIFDPISGRYVTRGGEVTGFEAAPQVIKPVYTPQPVTGSQITFPTQQVPRTPRRVDLHDIAAEYPPQVIEPGRTGVISGLGVKYNEHGEAVRAVRDYRFQALHALTKGSNVVLLLDDGTTLIIRWRSEGTLGRGWMVLYKEAGRNYFTPVYVKLD